MILVWIMLGIIGLFWILILNLIIFHLYLIYKGLTTFDCLFSKNTTAIKGKVDTKVRRKI
jgi:hypothetical protein